MRTALLTIATIASLVCCFGQTKNNMSPIKIVNANGNPVSCLVYKCTTCTDDRVEIGQTDNNGYADIGKSCLPGERFEFKPNDPNYSSANRYCSVREKAICLYRISEMANLTSNAFLPAEFSNDKMAIATAAMASLELSGIIQFSNPIAADTLRRNVYKYAAQWLDVKNALVTDSTNRYHITKEFANKLDEFQVRNGIEAGYIESTTLSKMATIPVWDVYTKKEILKKNY